MENMKPCIGKKAFTLLGADKIPYQSDIPGTLGGNGKAKIYGRLDCHSALRAIAIGGYVSHRVFFADEETAISDGYRPCGNCMRLEYARWKKEIEK
jgi:hypothetical protein